LKPYERSIINLYEVGYSNIELNVKVLEANKNDLYDTVVELDLGRYDYLRLKFRSRF